MSVHTKKLRIKLPVYKKEIRFKPEKKEKSTSWRETAKGVIAKHTEAGVMLRGARFKADLTQRELAERIEVSPHHISEMEHGKRTIGKAMAQRLDKVLNVNYKVFL